MIILALVTAALAGVVGTLAGLAAYSTRRRAAVPAPVVAAPSRDLVPGSLATGHGRGRTVVLAAYPGADTTVDPLVSLTITTACARAVAVALLHAADAHDAVARA